MRMDIIRCERLDQAIGQPLIEIRDVGDEGYLLSISLSDDGSYLSGPYPSATVAEGEGIARAEAEGVEVLYVVHTPRG